MRAKNLRLRACVCGVLAAASAVSATAIAAEEKATVLEEIVVTAERRDQSLQEVPLSITAFSDAQREKIGIVSIQDMANFAPGVSYSMNTDRPSIRGVARQSNFFSLDSPVANYFDGVYTSSVQDAQRRPIFIERTEILRGPQGSLAGRGSIGGSINTISKGPKDTLGGEVRVYGGTYSAYGLEGTVTGPINEWFRARLNLGKYKQEEGYFENVSTGGTEGDQPNNRSIADLILDFDLGTQVEMSLNLSFVDYNESRRTGYSSAPITAGSLASSSAYGPGSAGLTPLATWGILAPTSFSPYLVRSGTATQNPVITSGDKHEFMSDMKSNQQLDDHHAYKAHVTWHAPFADVKWIGGHQNYRYTQFQDVDGTDVQQMALPGGSATVNPTPRRVVNPGGTLKYMEDKAWYSNELTFTSNGDGAFSWIGGLYQSNEQYNQEPATTTFAGYNELTTPYGTVDRLLRSIGLPFDVTNANRVVVPNSHPNTSVVGLLDGENTTSAAFGQVEYKLNEQWKFALGLRYNKDDKEVTESLRYTANSLGDGLGGLLAGGNGNGFLFGAGQPARPTAVDVTPFAVPAVLPAGVIADHGIDPNTGYRVRDMKHSWEALTGSLGADWTFIENNMVFARASRGYRPGGFNAGFNYDPPMVDKETVSALEIGYKATYWDRLTLSSSMFYYDYRDVQLPLPTLGRCTDPADLSTCATLNSFVNLATASSKGVEIEAMWQATDDLNLLLSYGYLDARIEDALEGNPNGFSNPDDPAAILSGAKPYQLLGPKTSTPTIADDCTSGTVDTGYTNLCRRTQNLSGNKFANSPTHKAAFNANYTFHFGPGNLIVSGSYAWRSEQFSDVFETQESIVPSFSEVGARIIWTDSDNRYTVMFYGSNLANQDAADSASLTRLRSTYAGPGTVPYDGLSGNALGAQYFHNENLLPPREYGMELQYRFGGK